jgi:hypothetical protein
LGTANAEKVETIEALGSQPEPGTREARMSKGPPVVGILVKRLPFMKRTRLTGRESVRAVIFVDRTQKSLPIDGAIVVVLI